MTLKVHIVPATANQKKKKKNRVKNRHCFLGMKNAINERNDPITDIT